MVIWRRTFNLLVLIACMLTLQGCPLTGGEAKEATHAGTTIFRQRVLKVTTNTIRFAAQAHPESTWASVAKEFADSLDHQRSIRSALDRMAATDDPFGEAMASAICTGLGQVANSDTSTSQPPTPQSWQSFLINQMHVLLPSNPVNVVTNYVNRLGASARLATAIHSSRRPTSGSARSTEERDARCGGRCASGDPTRRARRTASVERVWDYPRPPAVRPCLRRVRIELGGEVIADSTDALRVLETSHPPTIYLPPADVRGDLLNESRARSTWCDFKGATRYLDAMVEGRTLRAIAWTFRRAGGRIRGDRDHVAFYPGRVDAAWMDDERVYAQEGDFYRRVDHPATSSGPSRAPRARSGW